MQEMSQENIVIKTIRKKKKSVKNNVNISSKNLKSERFIEYLKKSYIILSSKTRQIFVQMISKFYVYCFMLFFRYRNAIYWGKKGV